MALDRTDSPELWAFLESLQTGTILSGVVARIERFGVFVDMAVGDDVEVVIADIDRGRRRLELRVW